MMSKTVKIVNLTGLHARPAADFCKLAGKFDCQVYLEKESKKSNAKSIIGVLTLGISQGSEVDVITDGSDERNALTALVQFIENLEN